MIFLRVAMGQEQEKNKSLTDDISGHPIIANRLIALTPIPNQRLFGVGAAAQYLGISGDTLRKYADLGRIPVYRFINGNRAFKLEDLNRLIDELPLWHDPPSDTTRAGRV